MPIELKTETVNQIFEVLILYSQANAFIIKEYGDIYTLYKKCEDYLVGLKDKKIEETELDFTAAEVAFIIRIFDVASDRKPTNVKNFKTLGELYATLNGLIGDDMPKLEKVE